MPGGVPRVTTQEVELPNGTILPEGTAVIVSYGAANVDPTEFPDGFEVRFDRETNRHIAFGGGVHRCLGSHLARRELRVALRDMAPAHPRLRTQARPRGPAVHARFASRERPDARLVARLSGR